jgi:hypothetical protein
MEAGVDKLIRDGKSLAGRVATFFEKLGLLNPGSTATRSVPTQAAVQQVQPVSSNALNVTRVGGVTSLIAGAGGAALLLFKVDKAKDPHAIVVAAYASVGLIVAAALLTVAIIIAADIRARAAIAVATPPPAAAPSHDGTGPSQAARAPASSAGAPTASVGETEIVVLPGHMLQLAWDGQSWRVV